LLAQNVGGAFEPKFVVRRVLEGEANPPTRVQGADRPGRSVESSGGRRSAVDQTDWHSQTETRFAKSVADTLAELCRENDVRTFILVAAPKTLADLRACMPAAVRERTVSEIDKDLTNHPVTEVEKILAAL
jgi:protein required for attachment to host cells